MDTLEVYLYTLDFQHFANIREKTKESRRKQ